MTQPIAQRVAEDVRVALTRHMRRNPNTGRLEQLKQSELAAEIGMSQPALSRRLTGEIPFNLDDLERAARALKRRVRIELVPDETASDDDQPAAVTPGRPRGDDTP